MDIEQDRFQRQARRQSVWREESASSSPFQDTDPFASPPTIKRPRRVDTGISPLDPHPGHRLPSIKGSVSRRFSYVAPGTNGEIWSKPLGSTLEKVEENAPAESSSRSAYTDPTDAEDPLTQLERAAANGRTSNSYFVRLLNLLLRRSPVRRRGHSGLQVASAIATAHVPAFLKIKVQQGLVYICEYEKGKPILPSERASLNNEMQIRTTNHNVSPCRSIGCQAFKAF